MAEAYSTYYQVLSFCQFQLYCQGIFLKMLRDTNSILMDYRLRRNGTPLLCEILPLEIKTENEF